MTYEEVVEAALARTLDWDGEFPSTRLPMYRRIGTRQQQLFSMASKVNPDYYGSEAGAPLDAQYRLDLKDLAGLADLDQALGVQRIIILDAGASSYTAGDEVNIVSIDDIDADLPPRVTIRDQIIKGVGTDLVDVVSLCVKYPRVSDMPENSEDGTTDIQLIEAYQELLVIDLTKDLVRKCMSMDPTVKAAVQQVLNEEEQELLAMYMADVRAFAIGQHQRFGEPVSTATR